MNWITSPRQDVTLSSCNGARTTSRLAAIHIISRHSKGRQGCAFAEPTPASLIQFDWVGNGNESPSPTKKYIWVLPIWAKFENPKYQIDREWYNCARFLLRASTLFFFNTATRVIFQPAMRGALNFILPSVLGKWVCVSIIWRGGRYGFWA